MRFFLDANILIYTQDPRDPTKQAAARKWLSGLAAQDLAVINLQVINEVCHVALRKLPGRPPAEIRLWSEELRALGDTIVDGDVVESAWEYHLRFKLSWFDCLILGAADRLGCSHVVTEDMGADRRLGPLLLINPFRHDIDDVLTAG